MGFENTSDFGVRKSKSRKRTKIRNEIIEDNKCQTNSDINIGKISYNGLNHKVTKKMIGELGGTDILQKDSSDTELLTENKMSKRQKRRSFSTPLVEGNESGEDLNTTVSEESGKNTKTPSKRKLKKEKAEQREAEKRKATKLEATQKSLTYVKKWKYSRSEWKFEKKKQIWLMDNLLDDALIPDEVFPIVLEYFEGCKGMAREQLLKKGMGVVRIAEENIKNKTETTESVAYKRARLLLQALPTET
ncbi:hypothetical protein M0802_011419 [Mischocyttarus mexicanus]|nr:hypothetical protein M0802_011419 [Mischocyttarus mexicanus]